MTQVSRLRLSAPQTLTYSLHLTHLLLLVFLQYSGHCGGICFQYWFGNMLRKKQPISSYVWFSGAHHSEWKIEDKQVKDD